MIIINKFENDYDFLSNFYYCTLHYDGLIFESSEAAYQAAKTLDQQIRETFRYLNPGKAKRKGKEIKLRENWDTIKLQVMLDIVRAKFNQNPDIKSRLIDTGDAILVEGNDWNDCYWGVCDGEGLNHLGKILMRVRSEFCYVKI